MLKKMTFFTIVLITLLNISGPILAYEQVSTGYLGLEIGETTEWFLGAEIIRDGAIRAGAEFRQSLTPYGDHMEQSVEGFMAIRPINTDVEFIGTIKQGMYIDEYGIARKAYADSYTEISIRSYASN